MCCHARQSTSIYQCNSMPDHYRYDISRRAPSPCTGTPYPITDALESILGGPTLEDVQINASFEDNLTCQHPESACFHLEHFWTDIIPPEHASQFQILQDAIERLQTLNKPKRWGPDIVFKAFSDLDTVISVGLLKGSCKIRWMTYE